MINNSFKKNNTGAIRAVAALVVLFCHLNNTMTARVENPLLVLSSYGSTAVGVFFFYTGYNLLYSYISRENWSEDFWLKKISRIYLPFVLINIFGGITWTFSSRPPSVSAVVSYTLGLNLLNTELWYIQCCLIIYALFFVLFALLGKCREKLISRRWITALLCLGIWLIYGVVYGKFGAYHEKSAYRPWTMLFGMIVGIYSGEVGRFWEKRKWEIFFAAAFVGIVNSQYQRYGLEISLPVFGKLDYNQLRIFTVTVLANSLIMGENIQNRFLATVDKYSLYIYISHAPLYVLYRSSLIYIKSDLLYLAVYLISVAVSAFLLYRLARWLEKSLYGVKKKFAKA